MNEPYMIKLIYISVVLLVALIPAYLLYRALPGDAQAEGTLRGIRFKLGGAFAGYFVLVLTIFVMLPPDKPETEKVWTLYAEFGFSDMGGSSELLTVQTIPRNPTPTEDGLLKYRLVGTRNNGGWEFPDLKIGHENYITESILLDKLSREKDYIRLDPEDNIIHVQEPIILQKESEH